MSIDDFIRMMESPGSLAGDHLAEVQELVDTFPYFHSGHLLLLKNLHNIGHIRYNSQLKDSSVYVPDRKHLYHLIHDVAVNPPVVEKAGEGKPAGTEKTAVKRKEETVEAVSNKTEGQEKDDKYDRAEELPKETTTESEEKVGESQTTSVDAEHLRSREELLREIRSRLSEIGKDNPDDTEKHQEFNNNKDQETTSKHDSEDLFVLEEKADAGNIENIHEDDRYEPPVETDTHLLDLDTERESSPPEAPSSPETRLPESGNRKKKTVESADSIHDTSFTGWLDYFQVHDHASDQTNLPQTSSSSSESHNNRLIDNFLAQQPRITPAAENDEHIPKGDIAGESVKDSGLFSETLARIYLRQGYYTKAIFTYEKLRLKYPEKSSYFASQIKMIQKRLRDQTQN